jgi:hypothetical protein
MFAMLVLTFSGCLLLQAALDALDCGKRYIDYAWKDWGNPEEGGAGKPSLLA